MRGRLPLLSTMPSVTLANLKRLLPVLLLGEQMHDGCEQFASLRLLPDSVAAAI